MSKNGGNLGLLHNPGAAVKANLFLVCSYGQGEYLMVKKTSTPDVVNDDGSHYTVMLQILPL